MDDLGAEDYEFGRTQNTTPFLYSNAFWASPDFKVQTGVVVLDRKQERVLLVHNERLNMETFPREVSDDINALLCSPLRYAESVCGYRCHRLALPKLSKGYTEPDHKAIARITNEKTTEPFYMTFDTLFVDTPSERWPQGYQLITFWYAACVDWDSSHGSSGVDPSAKWVPLSAASTVLKGDEFGTMVLHVFEQLWNHLNKPTEHPNPILV
ncbi:hypothetical protein EXIGLDRAFT_845485 [Exidia glandulosa HHB12029]|uniref:Nudix hydrolase domain-containing protein n=1 Tax=Exidia glandulosa HHB12029 TaxID=1314781 RepID=A0A165BEU5_EXIGL|nr:hypothetical protein EXIGLDRAFT_845485 [Exidia glandulosa HHB12029]